MDKSFQIGTGKKSVTVTAPVVARLALGEGQPSLGWLSWLAGCRRSPERGLALRRIGGVALIASGIPVGVFALLCFPGLVFWLVGPMALLMVGQGVLLMYSRRSKEAAEAFRVVFKEALFKADTSDVVLRRELVNQASAAKRRILALCPVEGLAIDDAQMEGFTEALDRMLRDTFGRYAGPEQAGSLYGAFIDREVATVWSQGQASLVRGTVNVVRQSGGEYAIVEMPVTMNIYEVEGCHMPVNPIPRVFDYVTVGLPEADAAPNASLMAG